MSKSNGFVDLVSAEVESSGSAIVPTQVPEFWRERFEARGYFVEVMESPPCYTNLRVHKEKPANDE